MTLSNQIKQARMMHSMTQEELANMIGVSRQAVTKWESGKGEPDINNLVILSKVFHMSMDELLSDTNIQKYKSTTEYDIDSIKEFYFHLGYAHCCKVVGTTEEKLQIILSSQTLSNIQKDIKIKIQDFHHIDIMCNTTLSTDILKEELDIMIYIPIKYLKKLHIYSDTYQLSLHHLSASDIQLHAITQELILRDIDASLYILPQEHMNMISENISGTINTITAHQTYDKQIMYLGIFIVLISIITNSFELFMISLILFSIVHKTIYHHLLQIWSVMN